MISRIYGLGSVFGKTLRDSGRVALGLGLLVGILNLFTAATIADQFATAADRALFAAQMEALPALFQGLLGPPVNVEALPGFISWRMVGFLPIMVGFFSIVALTGTLAGEATSGTLELILSTPVSRVRLAVQKYGAHVVAVVVAMTLAAILTWVGAGAFATLPEDSLSILDALSEFGMVAVMALLAGSLGFALAPLLGRGVAAGVAAAYLFGSYAVNGYADIVPGFGILRQGSMFYWTEHHRPMAGAYDWPPVIGVAALAVSLAAIGVWLFQRRDLAATVGLGGRLRVRGRLLGNAPTDGWSLRGPGLRSLGERLPAALAWGGGLGLYGFVIAVSADEFAASLSAVPQIVEMIRQFYPNIDFSTAGGILQLAIFGFVALVAGVASGTLVAGWASDERAKRLELVMSTPIERVSWFIRSALGVLLSAFAIGIVIGLATALGAATAGDPALSVFSGGVVIGLYAAALAGFGILVFGLGFSQFAGGAVGGATLAFYLIDLLGGILQLPEFITDISLTRHLGEPMAGTYDWPGMAVCLAVAVGGTLVGAWRFARRDLG
ncbi:MAG: ABC transporter permease subunit [Chloroflexota bacterium]